MLLHYNIITKMDKHLTIATSLKERYKKTFSKNSPYIINGCSDIEIKEVEQKYNIKLPRSYYVFLSEFEKSSPSLLGDFYMEYPYPLTQTEEFMKMMEQDEEEPSWISPIQVPENLFVFANYYFDKIWFFMADDSSDDPPIFIADSAQGSGEVFRFQKVGESIWEFVEDCVKIREA